MLATRSLHPHVRLAILCLALAATLTGCTAKSVDFSTINRPERAPEMSNFDVFVGSWDWTAEMTNADDSHKAWSGTAKWAWTLDQRCLHGELSARSGDKAFNAAGVWSWHPTSKKYIWWMFNDWGFPQEGTAQYDTDHKTWTMSYRSVGLDGTASEGYYKMTVVDPSTLQWELHEWTPMRLVKKMEMKGTYKRK